MLFAALSHYPDSPRVHTGLASLYADQGDLDKALEHLDRAAGHPASAELGLAVHVVSAYCLTGRPPPPAAYERIEASPSTDDFYTLNALAWLTSAVQRGQCPDLDLAHLAGALHRATREALKSGSHANTWLLHTHTANLLAAAGRKPDALYHLDLASRLAPERLEAGLLALRYRFDLNDFGAAKKTLLELKQRDTGRVASHSRLIEDYQRRLEAPRQRQHTVE
jgi:tetratricopeptide (TPR) repeat protein